MKLQSFNLSLLALSLAHCGNLSAATGPQTTVKDKEKTERITVTATRKEQLDTDLPMAVESVGEKELLLDNGQHVAQSLNRISGVLINQLQGGQGHNAAIRMPINYSGYYLYLQDNIPLQSPAFFNHNALWWSSFNSNVSSMEVLKGAGTALYGSGAVAATVNVLSKGISKSSQSSIELDGGDNGYGKVGFSHSTGQNDGHSFRVSGSLFSNDGWRAHTAAKRGEMTLRHEYEIDSNEKLVTTLIASDLEQQMSTNLSEQAYLDDKTQSGLSDDVLATNPLRKTQYLRLSTQWTKDFDNSMYVSAIPYLRHRTNDYTATWNTNMPKVQSSVDSLGLLLQGGISHGDLSESILGLDIEVSDGEQLSYQPITIVTSGWGADTFVEGEKFYDDTTQYLGVSPYFQHKRQLSDNLELSLGLRYDHATYDFDNHLNVVGDLGHGLQSLADREDSFSHLSPKASLNYRFDDNASVYLRYANSFRMPTVGSLYHITTTDSSSEIDSLKAEISDTYEIGYKVNFDTLSIDVALYSMIVDDAIVNAYDTSGIRYQTNAGKASHSGFEFSSAWQVSRVFNLSFAYSRSKHEFDDFVVDAGRVDSDGNSRAKDYSNNEMKLAPEYVANLRLRYLPSQLEGFSSMLELKSIGDYWMDDENSRQYDGYTVANLKFSYQWNEQLAIKARISNLSDKEYAQQAEIRYGKGRFAPGASRQIFVGLDYQW